MIRYCVRFQFILTERSMNFTSLFSVYSNPSFVFCYQLAPHYLYNFFLTKTYSLCLKSFVFISNKNIYRTYKWLLLLKRYNKRVMPTPARSLFSDTDRVITLKSCRFANKPSLYCLPLCNLYANIC